MTANFFSALSFVPVLGSGIWDGKNQDPGSGMDPQHWKSVLRMQIRIRMDPQSALMVAWTPHPGGLKLPTKIKNLSEKIFMYWTRL
jgi:hypothetical protein